MSDSLGNPGWRTELKERLSPTALVHFLGVAFQLGLIVLLIRTFQIESRAFLYLAVYVWFGFITHHLLPSKLRMPFFGLLSLGSLVLVFGAQNTAWIVGTGMCLIGFAHLPIAIPKRIVVMLLVGVALAAARAGSVDSPVPDAVWPIIGAMFMFRMIVYMYDQKNAGAPFSFWHAVGYFFMLPSAVFPLFPVVDYKTFCRRHFDHDEMRVYQEGVRRIFRGCVHLIIYRLIYQNLLIDPAEISTSFQAAQYILTTYLLYLKISGSFHIIVGMLHLFGFRLPETHHNWLLANSFTDLWRRANIYWKNFMQKCFFTPAYLALEGRVGQRRGMILATIFVAITTWLLHSYQWFWIRGTFPTSWQDAVFWGLLGTCLLINMLYEVSHGRKRSLTKAKHTWRSDLSLAARTIGMLLAISMGWGIIWTAESWADVKHRFFSLLSMTSNEALIYIAVIIAFGMLVVALSRTARERGGAVMPKSRAIKPPTGREYWQPAVSLSVACLTLLVVGTQPQLMEFSPSMSSIIQDSRFNDRLSARDARLMERGYYEDLTDVTRFNASLQEIYADRPPGWNEAPHIELHAPYPPFRLRANVSVEYKGATLSSNQWGMRDRDYTLQKPDGVYRIAVLGSSHVMGVGVEDQETFENLVEDRLNSEFQLPGIDHFEILNFSISGSGPLWALYLVKEELVNFEPDAVLYMGMADPEWIINELYTIVRRSDIEYPFPFVGETLAEASEIIDRVGAGEKIPNTFVRQQLLPYRSSLLERTYREIRDEVERMGAKPLLVFLPRPETIPREFMEDDALQRELAISADFPTLDVDDIYAGVPNYSDLWIAKWDHHPNALGHRMIAEKLYHSLTTEFLVDSAVQSDPR